MSSFKINSGYFKKSDAKVYVDENGNGFVLGCEATVVPQSFVEQYNRGELEENSVRDYNKVLVRTDRSRLLNKAPAHAEVTNKGTLIIS